MNPDSNSNERRTTLRVTRDRLGADEEYRTVEFRLPRAWSIAQSNEERILLFPDDTDALTAKGFVPNVIIELAPEEPVSARSPADPPVLLASYGDTEDDGALRKLLLSIDETSSGESVYHLTGCRSRRGAVVSATCTSLEVQWMNVASAFDEVVDHLELDDSTEGATNGD